jgi:hypothetical protein
MSKENDELTELLKKEAELERRKKVVQEKELDLKEKRVEIAFNDLVKDKEEVEKSENVKFGRMSTNAVNQLVADNDAYMEAAKNPIPFINEEFYGKVPFFRKNLLLLAGGSGKGKSTAVANIINAAFRAINPLTGKPWKILVLTNEEAAEDFYNRLTCFLKGWQYSNHSEFTDEQRTEFSKFIKIFGQKGIVTVIGDRYEGISGWTTTVEGIVTIFDNMIRDKEEYDVVILDYIQGVVRSRDRPEANEYEAQRLLSNEFDRIKNIYSGAIVVMAQCDPLKDEDDKTLINYRLKGSKLIVTKATFICEIVADHEILKTTWVVHKSRFTDSTTEKIETGFDRGKFVPYSDAFKQNIAKIVNARLEKKLSEKTGLPNQKSKKEESEK